MTPPLPPLSALRPLLLLCLSVGCRCEETSALPPTSAPSAHVEGTAAKRTVAKHEGTSEPAAAPSLAEALLRLDTTAYHAQISCTEEHIYLLTTDSLYILSKNKPPEKRPLRYEGSLALDTQRVVFSLGGRLHEFRHSAEKPSTLAVSSHLPEYLTVADRAVAFSFRDPVRKTSQLYALHKGRERLLYESQHGLSALHLSERTLFFVEELHAAAGTEGSWRLRSVSIDGDNLQRGRSWRGRAPAFLRSLEDLYFYNGPDRAVVRISRDLLNEEVVARNTICSPLALGRDLYCSDFRSISQIDWRSGKKKTLIPRPSGPITTIESCPSGLLWVTDIGEEQLELSSLALPAPG